HFDRLLPIARGDGAEAADFEIGGVDVPGILQVACEENQRLPRATRVLAAARQRWRWRREALPPGRARRGPSPGWCHRKFYSVCRRLSPAPIGKKLPRAAQCYTPKGLHPGPS